MPRSLKPLSVVIACLAAVLPAFCVSVPGLAATRAGEAGPSPAAKACGALPQFHEAAAAQLMAGKLTIAPFKTVTVDPHRDGNVNWSLNPFGNPTWQVHGHSDHMGLTYFARGRNLIVDAGHTGYEVSAYRTWLRSPEAASMLVMPGVPFSAATATSLMADHIGKNSQFYEFYDDAFGGYPRYRSVLVNQRQGFTVVFDQASGASSYQQLWHLDPSLKVTTLTRSYAIASAPATKTALAVKLELIQVPLPGQAIPAGSTKVVRAQVNPYQGWVSHQMLQRTPDDVVEMTRTGSSAAMLTLIAGAPGTAIRATASGPAFGPYSLQVHIGAKVDSLTVTSGGTIS